MEVASNGNRPPFYQAPVIVYNKSIVFVKLFFNKKTIKKHKKMLDSWRGAGYTVHT